MDQISVFITQNWVLCLALVVVLAMLLNNLLGAKLKGYSIVSPAEATQLINHNDAVVLDVREETEYATGHIVNSIHIPQSKLSSRITELDKYKNKPVIIGCRSGNRSAQACGILKKQGFEHIHNLGGGMMAWQNANLPLTRH